MNNIKNETLEDRVNTFLSARIKKIAAAVCVIIVVSVAVVLFVSKSSSAAAADLDDIQRIEAALNLKADPAEEKAEQADKASAESAAEAAEGEAKDDESLTAEDALAQLAAYTGKSGVAGVRSNMLSAEILFAQKKYAEAADSWIKAAEADDDAYTAPVCYYNAASSYENLEAADLEKACANYANACEYEDFQMIDRALFNAGRTNEQLGRKDEAKSFYEKLSERENGGSWANLAKSRLIAIDAAE